MNEQLIRGVVLKYLHSRYLSGNREAHAEELIRDNIEIPEERLGRALDYLVSSGYLTVTKKHRGKSLVEKSFEITADGIDLAEGKRKDAGLQVHGDVHGDVIVTTIGDHVKGTAAGKGVHQYVVDVTLAKAPSELDRALKRFLRYVEEENTLPDQTQRQICEQIRQLQASLQSTNLLDESE